MIYNLDDLGGLPILGNLHVFGPVFISPCLCAWHILHAWRLRRKGWRRHGRRHGGAGTQGGNRWGRARAQ